MLTILQYLSETSGLGEPALQRGEGEVWKGSGILGAGRGGGGGGERREGRGCKTQTDVFRGHTKADPLETF